METLNIVVLEDGESTQKLTETLDLLALQRHIDPGIFRVTVVWTGNGTGNLPEEMKYPFRIDIIPAVFESRAKAYNHAIQNGTAPWMMFLEYGDTFADVYSLNMITDLLPTEEYDILWMEYCDEYVSREGRVVCVNVVSDVTPNLSGKLFRRDFLIKGNMWFDETIEYGEDTVFFVTAQSLTDYQRFAKISTRFIPYVKARKPLTDQLTETEIIQRKHRTNLATIRNIKDRGNRDSYIRAVMKTMCNAFHFLHAEHMTDGIRQLDGEIAELYRENQSLIDKVKEEDIEVFLDESEAEMVAIIQGAYHDYGHEMYFDTDGILFKDWIDHYKTGTRMELKVRPIEEKHRKPSAPKREDRVAVFCGTRNVYDAMETAAKSLMYHTPMDRVYFFIEDDEFPRKLPDNFICRNVSGQKFFDPKGKNFKSTWTYMCLMRAAFAKLMPNEHKVLSLDIDVIVNEDISELWDIDLSGYYYAGVPETEMSEKHKTVYANFGVIMMNLDMIRKNRMDDKVIESLNRDKWRCPEQDAFNHFCAGKICELPPMYNATRTSHITAETDIEKIAHYAGIRYWKHFRPIRAYSQMAWDEVIRHGSHPPQDETGGEHKEQTKAG